MADNTQLNVATTVGDLIRDKDKGGVKTSVVILDMGGAGVEVLLVAGQAVMAASLPVVIASNQTAVPVSDAGGSLTVDGTVAISGTVPVSGTVTANVGTTGGLALDATLTGGTQVAQAVGNVAAGAADSGNPVKIGGKANSAIPTAVTAGQRADSWFGINGQQMVSQMRVSSIGDSIGGKMCVDSNGGDAIPGAAVCLYNNSAFDRQRNNHEVTVLASAARTAAINSSDQVNFNSRTLYLTWDITAAGTGTLTLTIKYKDSLSGKYVTLLASAAQAGTGTVTLKVGPDLTAAANTIAKEALPRVWRAEVTGSDGSSWTYSVSANYSL